MANLLSSNYFQKVKKVENDYELMQCLLHQLGEAIDLKINTILLKSNFNLSNIVLMPKYRVKTTKSVIYNIFNRKNIQPRTNPLDGLQDKVGTRIVVLNEQNVQEIADILLSCTESWSIRCGRSLDKNNEPYKAIHLYVTPNANLLPSLSSLSKKELTGLVCEIQIKTNLQHTLNLFSHDLLYKNPYSLDGETKKKIQEAYEMIIKIDLFMLNMYNSKNSFDSYVKGFFKEIACLYINLNHKLAPKVNEDVIRDTIQNSDHNLNALIFSTYEVENIAISDVISLCSEKASDIEYLINSDTYLVNEPIVIFIVYLFYKKRHTLKSKWFLSDEILSDIFHGLGYAYDYD
jgi:ppGpp synthetase/RelA/SpoT-type nucleotidyltranferase